MPRPIEKSNQRWKDNFKKRSRGMSVLYLILITIVIAVLVSQSLSRNYENCFTCVLTLLLFLIPAFVERRLKITLPNTLEVIIILFIFSAEILGEINEFYLRIPWWDTLLHTSNGFLMAAIGLSLIDIFNRSEIFTFKLSPFFVVLVAFCFSMTIGVLWEFFEFSMDYFAHTDMQKDTIIQTISTVDLHPLQKNVPVTIQGIENLFLSGESMTIDGADVAEYAMNLNGYLDIGLYDTMIDLFVNFVGAIIFSVFGFFYVKNRGKGSFVSRFLPRTKWADFFYSTKEDVVSLTDQVCSLEESKGILTKDEN